MNAKKSGGLGWLPGRWAGVSLAVALPALLLAGCVSHTWAPGPDAQGTFEEAKARCSLMARASERGFYASGSPRFVAGAALGAAVGNAVEAQANFNDCMSATGWIAVDAKAAAPTPAQANAVSRLQAVLADSKMCIANIQQKPTYAAISSHVLTGGRYTLTQLSDTNIPTPDEAKLVAEYGDETAQCRDRAINEISQMDPRAARTLQEAAGRARDLDVILIHRQMSWGEHAHQVQGVLDAAEAGRPIPAVYTPAPVAPAPPQVQNSLFSGLRPLSNDPSALTQISTPRCTHQQEAEARIARLNGYTGGPKCE